MPKYQLTEIVKAQRTSITNRGKVSHKLKKIIKTKADNELFLSQNFKKNDGS